MTGWSSSKTVPSAGYAKPAMVRSKVVLPHQDGPGREKSSPLLFVKPTLSNAWNVPKFFDTLLIETVLPFNPVLVPSNDFIV